MFTKLFAVCLLVDDFEKSLKFYKDTLGLKVKTRDKNKFANFDLEGTELAIFQKDEATTMFPKKYMHVGGGVSLGFLVSNLDKACSDLGIGGVEIIEGPKTTSWGQKVAHFRDPDGNIWEISEPFVE